MTWEITVLVFSAAAVSAGAVLGVGIWYVKRFVREFTRMEKEKKKETLDFLRTSIEHMEALHAGTGRQIQSLKEHAEKLEVDLK
jgi:hypothetical protein